MGPLFTDAIAPSGLVCACPQELKRRSGSGTEATTSTSVCTAVRQHTCGPREPRAWELTPGCAPVLSFGQTQPAGGRAQPSASHTHAGGAADPPLELLSDEDDVFPALHNEGDGDLALLRLLTRLRFTGDGGSSDVDIVQLLAAAAGGSSLGDEAADMMAAVSALDAELAGMRHRDGGGRAGSAASTAVPGGQAGGQPRETPEEVVTSRQAALRAAFTHALVWDSLRHDAVGDTALEALMEATR